LSDVRNVEKMTHVGRECLGSFTAHAPSANQPGITILGPVYCRRLRHWVNTRGTTAHVSTCSSVDG